MNERARAAALLIASTFGSGWAALLVQVHRDAVRQTLEPGVLCGADGGCGEVLASEWSTIAGVPVSLPAVPLYGAIAVCAALVLAGRLPRDRVASLGVAVSGLGTAFGGALLWLMLVDIGHVCRYCLVMDGATLGVLVASLALHSGGPMAAVRGLPDAARGLLAGGPELAVAATSALGTLLLAVAWPEPQETSTTVVALTEQEAAKLPPLPQGQAEVTGETRRIVIPAERSRSRRTCRSADL
jgi:uncharacterized membrane protein